MYSIIHLHLQLPFFWIIDKHNYSGPGKKKIYNRFQTERSKSDGSKGKKKEQ